MKSIKTTAAIIMIAIFSCLAQPTYAQSWKKAVGKEAAQVAKKVFSKGTTKQAEKAAEEAARKGVQKSGSSYNAGAAAARAASQYKEVTCSRCAGHGVLISNGYYVTCPDCNGKGKKIVHR